MELLDELSLGFRGQIMSKDKYHPPVASPAATADYMASMLDAPQTSFDVLWQTLVHLSLAVRWEQDPSLSESNSQDLLPGAPLCAMPPTSALRQCIQMHVWMPNFAVDFCLVAKSPLGCWTVNGNLSVRAGYLNGDLIQGLAMPRLAWLFKDWVSSHTNTMPNNLGPATIHDVTHLTMNLDVYSWLETCGMLGMT